MIYLSHEILPSKKAKLLIQKDSETPCYWTAYNFQDLVVVLSEISNYLFSKSTYNAYFANTLTDVNQRFTINYYDEVVLSEDLKLWLVTTFWEKNFPSFAYDFQSPKIETPDLLKGL